MKFAYISQVIAFIAFHAIGMAAQLSKLLQQSHNGEFSSILNVTDIFASPLPIYLLQFILIALASTGLFIVSQAHFAVFLSHKFEQHISQETEFVLLSPVDDIYRLSGISRDTLVRHANKKVIINGTIDTDSHSIKVQQLQVQLGNGLGRYESVWQAP